MRKTAGRGRGAARGRRRRSTGCTPGWPSSCGPGAPSARSAGDIAEAIIDGGARHRRLRHRRLGPERRQPAPRAVRPGASSAATPVVVDIGGTTPERLLLRLRPGCTRVGEPPADFVDYYDVLQRRAAGGLRRRPAGRHVRVGRRGRARGHRRRAGYGELLHPPHRPRHRPGDPRGALHRRGQHRPCSSPAWRSPSSRASTCRARTAPASRTSSCCTEDGVERLNHRPRDHRRAARRDDREARSTMTESSVSCRPTRPRRCSTWSASYRASELAPQAAAYEAARRASRARCSAPSAGPGCSACPTPRSTAAAAQPYEVYLQVVEELAAGLAGGRPSASACTPWPASRWPPTAPTSSAQRWLPEMLGGELLGAYCLSEPQSGSDAAALTTRAVRDGDDYVVDGTKAWITHGGVADFYSLMARTSDDRRPRHLLPARRPRDAPGLSAARPEHKMGVERPRHGPGPLRRRADRAPTGCSARRARASASRWPRSTAAGSASPPAPSALAQAALDAAARLRQGAPPVRPTRSSTSRASAFMLADMATGSRGRPRALPGRGPPPRRGQAVRHAGGDGQAVRHRHGDEGHHRRRPGARWLRLRRGLPGRALHARGQGRCRSSRAPTRSSGW